MVKNIKKKYKVCIDYKLFFSYFFLIINFISKIICDINIHVIPHSHLDPGWLYTTEEYYTYEEVDEIFKTVTNELYDDVKKQKTFIINEIIYFKRWYDGTHPRNQYKIKNLIKEKRIEFVTGGFVANDEATTSYYDIVNQIRLGQQFLLEEFGIIPKTAMFIDSFGHSAGNAHLMAQLNFKNLILGRMHVDYLELFQKKNWTEFYWLPFDNNNSYKTIFTHILPLHYGYSLFQRELGSDNKEFCKDAKYTVLLLLNHIKKAYQGIIHKNIMFLYGDDYAFKDKNLFLNIDCLMNVFNDINDKRTQYEIRKKFGTTEKINFFYSTPEKYFKAVKEELSKNNKNLPNFKTFSNFDLFPLKTDCFWTGFFTSRPFLKGYIRKASNAFYSMSKYFSMNTLTYQDIYTNDTKLLGNLFPNLNFFKEMVSLTQHHDAITGTSKQYVSSDYIDNLRNIMREVEQNFRDDIEKKLEIKIGSICYNNFLVEQKLCSSEFMISSSFTGKNKNKIGILNPMTRSINSTSNNVLINIEIFNSYNYYEVEGIKSDFFCINDKILKNEEYFRYGNKCFLNFFYEFKKGEDLIYITLIKLEKGKKSNKLTKLIDIENQPKIELIKNTYYIQNLTFFPKNFEFFVEFFDEHMKLKNITFTYYDGMYYGNADKCNDGAYQFSPYNKYPEKINIDIENSFYIIGNIGIIFVTRNIDASVTFFIIFYDPFFIKVEHFFDSVADTYFLNKFSFGYSFVFKTNIKNHNKNDKSPIFYTDSNGIEMMKRTVDKFKYIETANIKIGGNFYPVSSSISIKDEFPPIKNGNMVTIFNDRPQAGSGIVPGAIVLILQRMSYGSDNKGLSENLYEVESMNNTNFKTTHFIVFGVNINNYNKINNTISPFELKTSLLNFIYNYFNTGILMFKIEKENRNIDLSINNQNNILNHFYKYIEISPDIRVHFELIHTRLVIGEFFKYNNYYFGGNNTNTINNNNNLKQGTIYINFPDDAGFSILYDKTGIKYKKNETDSLSPQQKAKLIKPKNQFFSLNNNEFLFIYFYFDN